MRTPGRARTTASCSAYPMINGVIWAGISAGSNHAGAMVTWRAYTTSPLGWATTLCTTPTVNATTIHHMTSQAFIIAPFRFSSLSPRLPLAHLLHTGCEQYLHHLPGHTARMFLQFSIRTRRERMWHINHRIVRHPPYGRSSPTGGHKMISADGGSRNTGTVQMDTVVHTARAARASISHPDNGQITELCPLLDHLRRHGLRGRGFAVPYDVTETILLIENLCHHFQEAIGVAFAVIEQTKALPFEPCGTECITRLLWDGFVDGLN